MASKSQPKDPLIPHPDPPPDFPTRTLPVVESTGPWYRLNPVSHSSALYFDRSGRGRFDGPTQGYGILYAGEDEYAAFIECYGRVHGARGVAEAVLKQRNLFAIASARPLVLVDLTGSNLVKLGADARISSGSYSIARAWAQAIWQHPLQVDGVRYRSRHDDERLCCGLFDRVRPHLSEQNLGNLVDSHPLLLSEILARYDYGLL
ncbi:MAG: RES family NAD+ phosphorylase [Cyanosarcina radialis HA8281-LM2]|nr:RES family NAD+ phosphorylase [Cyanosarcina radialis HA8281-LM2]